MFVVGPALGFILGGALLDVYTDFDVVAPSELPGDLLPLTPEHPLWVGAWWVGFAAAALAAWIGALAFSLYPPELPSAQRHNQVMEHKKTYLCTTYAIRKLFWNLGVFKNVINNMAKQLTFLKSF